MAIIYKDIVTWLKGWFYTKGEVDDKLTSRNISEDTALPNLEVLASANQHEINLAIDEKIGQGGGGSGGVSLACVSDFIVNLDDLDDVELELSACTGKVISEVAKTGTVGLVDNYTIYYNDGSTYSFQVTNGSDASVDIVTSWSSTTSDSKVPSEKLVKNSLDGKQATLVSGTNLKTINNESLLGSGNIFIQGGSNVDVVTSWSSTLSDTSVPSEKLTKNSLDAKFPQPVNLVANDNIDTLLTNGFYVVNDNGVGILGTLPSIGDKAFTLLVDGDSKTKRQVLTYYKTYNRTFTRMYSGYTSNLGWSDWKEISTVGHSHTTTDITNFPSLSTVATSGSYSDLSNKPSIPSSSSDLSDGSSLVKTSSTSGLLKNDGSVMASGTGASNWAVGNHTHSAYVNPTKVTSWSSTPSNDNVASEKLIKDSLDGKQATLVSGTSIKTINNESLLGSGNINIQGGGGSVIGTGSFSIDNNGHLIVELPNGVDNPYFINSNGHLVYDTSNTYNGE